MSNSIIEHPISSRPFDFSSLDIIKEHISGLSNIQKIEAIEYWMSKTVDNIAQELPLTHYLSGGVYVRELFIPQGVILIGKIHLHTHLAGVIYGDISVMCDSGIKRISGHSIFESSAGAKRIGFAHADTLFITMHKTDKTDIPSIEEELFCDSDLSWVEKTNVFGELI